MATEFALSMKDARIRQNLLEIFGTLAPQDANLKPASDPSRK